MLNASVAMATLVEYVTFFPELVKIYKLCQQQGFLRVKIQNSLNEILPAFSVTHFCDEKQDIRAPFFLSVL